MLIEGDLRKPKVADLFGLERAVGLSNLLANQVSLDDVVQSWSDNVSILASGTLPPNPSELLGSPRMTELLKSIETEMPNHVVIFDMPPLTYDDVLSFAPQVDCVLLVIAEGQTERADLTKAKELLEGMRLVGVVLNRSAERASKSYYYY